MDREIFQVQIADRLGGRIGNLLIKAICLDATLLAEITEIRLRMGRPVSVKRLISSEFLSLHGKAVQARQAYQVTTEDLSNVMSRICQHSRYAFQSDIQQGYVTIPGGHRIGIAGKMLPDGTMTDVSGLTIRIGKAVPGAANKVFPYVLRGQGDVYSTLIISPPGCGKTTILRDLMRLISNGTTNPYFTGLNVGVVDERSELAATIRGRPVHDVGLRTDIYDGCGKEKGIMMMLRGMAPDVIVLDELGGAADVHAVESAMYAGVRFMATMHGFGIDPACLRLDIQKMIERELFERYVVLSCRKGPGTIEGIFDQKIHCIYPKEGNL